MMLWTCPCGSPLARCSGGRLHPVRRVVRSWHCDDGRPCAGSMPSERDVRASSPGARGRGMYVLRLDYPGVGHSSGGSPVFDLESPPAWAMEAAARFLIEETPVERVILAGSCFGARWSSRPLEADPRGRLRRDDRGSCSMRVGRRWPAAASDPTRAARQGAVGRAADNPAQQSREGNLATEQRVSPPSSVRSSRYPTDAPCTSSTERMTSLAGTPFRVG